MSRGLVSFYRLLSENRTVFPMRTSVLFITLCLSCALSAAPAMAQDTLAGLTEEEVPPVEVLVLGTFHFTQAPDFNDVMAPEQQAEIRAIVDTLAEFHPTKVLLEMVKERQDELDSLYSAYRSGRHELTPNERQQLGFRLADRLGHERVYAVDYKQEWPMKEVLAYAEEHEPWFVDYFDEWQEQMGSAQDSLHCHASIKEILRWQNEPRTLDRIQEARMRTLEVGAASTYAGLRPVTSVYERNFRIFANILHAAEPGDRVLLIFGSGHSYFFQAFARQHPHMKLVDPLDYL